MIIEFEFKNDDVFPYGRIRTFKTPFTPEDKDDDWECAFVLDSTNELNEFAFRLFHIQGDKRTQVKKWFCLRNCTWQQYTEWLGHEVLSIAVDGKPMFKAEDFDEEEK